MPIQRTTLFKLANESDIPTLTSKFNDLATANKRVLSMQPSQALPDARNQGFNFVCLATFNSMNDVKQYDEECETHRQLREWAKPKLAVPPVVVHVEV